MVYGRHKLIVVTDGWKLNFLFQYAKAFNVERHTDVCYSHQVEQQVQTDFEEPRILRRRIRKGEWTLIVILFVSDVFLCMFLGTIAWVVHLLLSLQLDPWRIQSISFIRPMATLRELYAVSSVRINVKTTLRLLIYEMANFDWSKKRSSSLSLHIMLTRAQENRVWKLSIEGFRT